MSNLEYIIPRGIDVPEFRNEIDNLVRKLDPLYAQEDEPEKIIEIEE